MHHDLPTAGHPGRWNMYELVSRNYWWSGMSIFVKHYVTDCNMCQHMKNHSQQLFGPLMPNEVLQGPWENNHNQPYNPHSSRMTRNGRSKKFFKNALSGRSSTLSDGRDSGENMTHGNLRATSRTPKELFKSGRKATRRSQFALLNYLTMKTT